MCIICSDPDIGQEYLNSMASAIYNLKKAEKALLKLSKKYPKSNYDKAHKMLVKRRKRLGDVEQVREANET